MTKISDLKERIDRLGESENFSLTTEGANSVRAFWIQLNHSHEEAEEYSALEKRGNILYEKWLSGRIRRED